VDHATIGQALPISQRLNAMGWLAAITVVTGGEGGLLPRNKAGSLAVPLG
jgi:hypothetical protein